MFTVRGFRYLVLLSVILVVVWSGGCSPAPQTGDQAAPAAGADAQSTQPPAAPPEPEPKIEVAPGEVKIIRDEWGVPHIFAKSSADAAFGLGYAQAEDRLEDLYRNVRLATGTMAEAFGPEHAEMDFMLRLVRNAEVCQAYWDKAPAALKAMGDSFMRGVEAFVKDHPEKKPEFACDLYGWQCAAIGRTLILQWPMGTLMDELGRKKDAPPFGSNGWAVSPSKSAEGCSILLTDPHLTWEGIQVFYEARVHCDDFEISGFYIVGAPLPALGHSANVAWACTTGGPDTSDVYMMKVDPKLPAVYEYDGQPKAGELKPISIPVKGQAPVVKPAIYTVHGPAIEEPDTEKGIMYVGDTPYMNEAGLFEQIYQMVLAKNCDGFYEALKLNQFMEQNLIFADREGNIQYVRVGRTPIRPEGYDFSVPVPGNTSATQWLGLHPIEDLVQIKNPEQGYMQNCNISPENMMKNSPMTPDKYKSYIYNVSWDDNNSRGRRAVEILSADGKLTKDQAKVAALDIFDILSTPWQKALKAAVDAVGAEKMADAAFKSAVDTILAWDGKFTRDSKAAPIVKFWRLKCENAIDIVAVADEQPVTEADQRKMLDLLSETLAELTAKYNKPDLTWGDINLVGRGGKYFPCNGADFGGGKDKRNETETLHDVSSKEMPDQPGKFLAHSGSESIMLSFMHKDGIESYSCVVWGQSGDPNSPHYVDQSEKLYSGSQLKPTWFAVRDLVKHVESEKTLKTQ